MPRSDVYVIMLRKNPPEFYRGTLNGVHLATGDLADALYYGNVTQARRDAAKMRAYVRILTKEDAEIWVMTNRLIE